MHMWYVFNKQSLWVWWYFRHIRCKCNVVFTSTMYTNAVCMQIHVRKGGDYSPQCNSQTTQCITMSLNSKLKANEKQDFRVIPRRFPRKTANVWHYCLSIQASKQAFVHRHIRHRERNEKTKLKLEVYTTWKPQNSRNIDRLDRSVSWLERSRQLTLERMKERKEDIPHGARHKKHSPSQMKLITDSERPQCPSNIQPFLLQSATEVTTLSYMYM